MLLHLQKRKYIVCDNIDSWSLVSNFTNKMGGKSLFLCKGLIRDTALCFYDKAITEHTFDGMDDAVHDTLCMSLRGQFVYTQGTLWESVLEIYRQNKEPLLVIFYNPNFRTSN